MLAASENFFYLCRTLEWVLASGVKINGHQQAKTF